MSNRVAVVFNPGSGQSDEQLQSEILGALRGLGEVRAVHPGSEESFAADVSAGTKDAGIVVAAGGDGTLNLMINALEERLDEHIFAVVPLGTGNDFARTLGLPSDPLEAAVSLQKATERAIDLGVASGAGTRRLFVNACMGGFPVEANKAIDAGVKKLLGPLAFILGGAKALGDLDRSTVVVDGQRITDCIALGIGNGRTAGGGIEIWPEARPDDGRLDLCVLSAGSMPAAVVLGAQVKAGKHEAADGTEMFRAAEFAVDADPPLEFNVDGELVGLRTPARFELLGRARFLSAQYSGFRDTEQTERS